jgi:histidinol dehydrogenase
MTQQYTDMKITRIQSDEDYEKMVEELCHPSENAEYEKILADKVEATKGIVEGVRVGGDYALADYTKKFDGVELKPGDFEIGGDELDAALASLDDDLRAAIERAHSNIQRFHSKHLRESWEEEEEDGTILGQRVTPIESAGVYVPGGTAFYPSSVLMNIVPAKVAGVKDIVMVSPPSYEGTIHPVVLAAARIAGATRVFRVGGAQAIAALAYGTETIPQVMKITGPGNTFVAVAKGLVQSIADIDTEAGPSEVTIIADLASEPWRIAGEMMAQAEHDPEASCVLLTTDATHVNSVRGYMETDLRDLDRADIIRKSITNNGRIVVVRNLDEAVKLSNIIGPEHLCLYNDKPRDILDDITAAGSIMVGQDTTVVFGDYIAGPNHILPTGRRARFSSPLTAEDFRKVSSVIQFSKERMKAVSDDVVLLAKTEKLTAHARAVEIRLRK